MHRCESDGMIIGNALLSALRPPLLKPASGLLECFYKLQMVQASRSVFPLSPRATNALSDRGFVSPSRC